MRNRDTVLKKLDSIEASLNALRFMVNQQQPIKDFLDRIEYARETVDQLKGYIESEPINGNELNKTR
jgi:DNA-binding FrmR family transcriptional regulator